MKTMKKLISVLLAVVLFAVPVFTVGASAKKNENGKYPIIEVPGFMAGDLYAVADDKSSDVIWPISADFILGYVKQLLPSVGKLMITHNWNKFGEEAAPLLKEMLGTAVLDINGDASDGSGAYTVYPSADKITKSSIVTFRYDWRLDPMEIAAQLNDFIEYVCDCAGTDKVCVTGHSLGGLVCLTYVTLYGYERIQSLALNSSAMNGATYDGELMSGKIILDGESLTEYLKYAMDGNEYEKLVDGILILLDDMKLTDFVAKFGNRIVEKLGFIAIPEVVLPMFAFWPAIWAMVPDADLENAKNYVFNEVYANNGNDYSGILAKIEAFDVVRENREKTLNELKENASLYLISRYGYSAVPLTPSWRNNSDGVIDTMYSSFGATIAPYGSLLDDAYIAAADAAYISPDHTLDASTCLFPEQTWFIHGLAHSATPDSLDELIYTLLRYDGQATVDTFEQYPRFMKFDHVDEELYDDDTQPPVKVTGFAAFVEKIRNFFGIYVNLFKTLFGLMFGK